MLMEGMNEELKKLIELQQIDSRILTIERAIALFPRKIAEAESPFKALRKALDDLKQRQEAFEKKKRDKERAMDEADEKIRKLKARTSEIKTNKEYQALLKEIELIEKERSAIEDEILLVLEEMDSASQQMKREEEKFKGEAGKIDALKKTIGDEKSESEKELSIAMESRSKIAETVAGEVYSEYVQLIEACNGSAVVEARNEICQGCNMNIPPQLFVELKKNEEILHCPQCRRILYYSGVQ